MKNTLRTYIIASWLATAATPAAAQDGYRPANAQETADIKAKIESASAKMNSLQCDFEQTKTISILAEEMHSSGVMTYRQPDVVHWEYRQPYPYVFAMNGDKVTITADGRKNEIDVASSKLFREISAIILSGINGRDIFNESRFAVKYLTGATGFLTVLSPKQKEIKQIFHEIRLFFDAADHTIYRVDLQEAGGDRTVIRMKNKKIN
jgi:outer membrane lipoprotein carrier protein